MKNQKSLKGKLWKNKTDEKPQSNEEILNILLAQKQLQDPVAIQNFLSPSLSDLHSPWDMLGMSETIDRIQRAIVNKERIMIFGDFDADGITSTVILQQGLEKLGAHVSYRIPNRVPDSHGLKDYLIDEIADRDVSLIITCDCGINDRREVQYASDLGIDVIITDHHDPDPIRRPKSAISIINPLQNECEYPDKNLSGSGIAFKVVSALAERMLDDPASIGEFLFPLLEICTIGLVADCMELVGENRILAKFGIEKIKHTSWPGLQLLLEQAKVVPESITEETIGFTIAPRLNAASRIGDVRVAVQLFLGDTSSIAERLSILEQWNQTRKQMTQMYREAASTMIQKDAPFQFLFQEDWHAGILGLIAGQYSESLDMPIIAASMKDKELVGASCRAPEGYHMSEALQSCADLFVHFGGHAGAAGFVAESKNISEIQKRLTKYFLSHQREISPLYVDLWLEKKDLKADLLDFISYLRPFGRGNIEPVFGMKDVKIIDWKPMGKNENHLRLSCRQAGEIFEIVFFFANGIQKEIQLGHTYDLLVTLSANIWNEKRSLQLRLQDLRPCL